MASTSGRQSETGWAAALPFYYGWLVLGASAIIELLMTGATAFSAGLFVLPLQAEFHLSRADASSPVLILYSGAALCGPVAGRILDRFPIRPVMCVGAILFCYALVSIALTSSLWLMVLALLLPAALGYLVLGMLNTATLASRWFFRHRGLALGIAAVATSGGGFITPLLARTIRLYGWRMALMYEAAFFAVIVVVLAFAFIRDSPARMGLESHPENSGRDRASAAAEVSGGGLGAELRRWREILGRLDFWGPSLVVATVSGISQAIVTAAVPYGAQLGFAATAALLVTGFSVAAALTKILGGVISDMVDKRLVLLFAVICMMASLMLLCLFPGYAALFAACCLAGMALGGALPTSAALIAARFGSARFGATMGWTYLLIGVLTIAAVRVSGSVFDATGSYHGGFEIFLGFTAAIALTALALESALARR